MLLYGSLLVLAVLAGRLVYRYDLYDKEPVWMLILAGFLGGGSMVITGKLEEWSFNLLGSQVATPVGIATIAATHEELARLLVVVLIALIFRKHFNDPMDGLIYGSMVGLGMAVAESLYYLNDLGITDGLLPRTEIIRLCGHLVLSGITCFGVGMARMKMRRWPLVLVSCVAFAMLLHFLWDWIAFTVMFSGRMVFLQNLAAVGVMLGGMLVYGMLVVIGADWSRRVFAPHSPRQLWGWPFDVVAARVQRLRWNTDQSRQPKHGDPD